ncbi:MAG: TonB-dependent receptor [Steroidobacteraceae bacterium]
MKLPNTSADSQVPDNLRNRRYSFGAVCRGLLPAVATCAALVASDAGLADDSEDQGVLQEITVTAQRRSEDINKVPINITAYSEAQMDDQGIHQIDDISRLTPDLQFTHTSGAAGNNSNDIAIRGVYSDVGAATTGIYIDDTPIQMRNLGYWNANAFPQVFDLQRVEVLRGPQGTLFGAGAEGGAVRFILPEPGLNTYSAYARTELSETVSGTPSYELGGALGGPIIDDKLGFRVSAWGRNDGGYIDRVSPDTGQPVDSNSNSMQSFSGRAAVTAVPIDNLKITAAVLYQNINQRDRDQYWSTISDPSSNDFQQGSRIPQPTRDRFVLPSLKLQYDFDKVSFVSNTSYFYHLDYADLDYTTYFGGIFDGNPLQFLPGDKPSEAYVTNHQNAITEEARLQSSDPRAFLAWTAGVFYSGMRQNDQDITIDRQAVYTSTLGDTVSFAQFTSAEDRQVAGYADVDLNVLAGLKLSAGVRVSSDRFTFDQVGSYQGFGLTPVSGTQSDTPVTPKFGLSYQLNDDNFVYATAAKGFRQGGVNAAVPTALCASDLAALGLTTTPTSYQSDSLWSYELGAKNNLFGGRLGLDTSLYTLRWNDIQESVRMPSCGFNYVANLGTATGYGADLAARFKLTNAWLAGVNAGYVDLTYDKSVDEGANAVLVNKGDVIGGPPFHLAAWSTYNFNLLDHRSFVRLDYTYQNGFPAVDGRTFGFDPTLPVVGAERSLSLRAGAYIGRWEVSLFANNLTQDESPIAISHDIPGALPYYESSLRPLTVGASAEFRY